MKFKKRISHFLHPQRSNNHRAGILKPASLFILAFFCISALVSVEKIFPAVLQQRSVILGVASDITASQIITLVNNERLKVGLHPLQSNPQLSRAAEAKAADMFRKQYWAHVSPEGKQPWTFISEANYEYLVAGENLARDFQTSQEVIDAWMGSPTHRANILHRKYTEIGLAVVNGTLEGLETTLVVQMFGAPNVAEVVIEKTEVQVIATKEPEPALGDATIEEAAEVLASQALPTSLLEKPIVLAPVAILKGLFLGILILIITTLIYDFVIATHNNVVRVVGKNMAHVFLFLTVIYLLLYYKGGFIL